MANMSETKQNKDEFFAHSFKWRKETYPLECDILELAKTKYPGKLNKYLTDLISKYGIDVLLEWMDPSEVERALGKKIQTKNVGVQQLPTTPLEQEVVTTTPEESKEVSAEENDDSNAESLFTANVESGSFLF